MIGLRRVPLVIFLFTGLITAGQNQAVDLTFTAVDNLKYVMLDSVKVINRTQGIQTMVYWPDTSITVEINAGDLMLCIGFTTVHYVEIPEAGQEIQSFQLYQNFPNPADFQTDIRMYLPEKGRVVVRLSDLQGRTVLSSSWQLAQGSHSFSLIPGQYSFLVLTASWNGIHRSIKIISTGHSFGNRCVLDYRGSSPEKAAIEKSSSQKERGKVLESGILDTPDTDKSYTFQFAQGIPCPGTPTIEYQGQTYGTIQVFSQCWMRENLNIGSMILSDGPGQLQTDNGVIEKYCWINEPFYCSLYGGLYEWDEAIQYVPGEGTQGICPEGWHIPSDEEWKLLEGSADSEYPLGDPQWDLDGIRGTDAGGSLKEEGYTHWENPNTGATNASGFDGLPASCREADIHGYFGMQGEYGFFWTSTQYDAEYAWMHHLDYSYAGSGRGYHYKPDGNSVRCLRDVIYLPYSLDLTFTAVNNSSHILMDSIVVMNRTRGQEITLLWPDTVLILQTELPYSIGDELLYIGYSNAMESGKYGKPQVSEEVTFQFATNIPCPGTQTVYCDGRFYNTVQIFNQCWLKESLNAGTMISGSQDMTDNGLTEKYCYNNDTYYCSQHGGLYTWDEMMQYEDQEGARGICPPDWHIPSDDEWKLLEGGSDNMFTIGDPEWDSVSYRGFDAGMNLKTTTGWVAQGNGTDLYGFAGYPGGSHSNDGTFSGLGSDGHWMTSSAVSDDHAWLRTLGYLESKSCREHGFRENAFNVRCIRNDVYNETFTLTFTAINDTEYVQLDQIKISNLSQDGSKVLTWPDTTLLLEYELPYKPGDELLLVGYAGAQESGIILQHDIADTVVFQFAAGIPCPGMPTVLYGSQIYNTVQIFNQCWFKENLNYGLMVLGSLDMTDNGFVEKYCYDNNPAYCDLYGGLYQWDEVMQYTLKEGARGICPLNWHIPTDDDWMILSGATDSQYSIGSQIWNNSVAGFDVGTNLKTIAGWINNGNGTDLYGFSGLPGGYNITPLYEFYFMGDLGHWWTSVGSYYSAMFRGLDSSNGMIERSWDPLTYGLSVRCIRDD
ncbi:MAG TPA: FISUMP domain-containing protein [Bacteroidales bacterium]|nr:FISUMP domain-containing protein [Bacteroidales bacterium]